MFQLDDKFLQDLGLDAMPAEQKQAFLQHIYEELELRVGTKLSDGLSDQQLDEFEGIIDKKEGAVDAWLAANAPQYQTDEVFVRLQQSTGLSVDDPRLAAEFAATKWLELNRPDYRDVVAAVLEDLKREIMGSRDQLLS